MSHRRDKDVFDIHMRVTGYHTVDSAMVILKREFSNGSSLQAVSIDIKRVNTNDEVLDKISYENMQLLED